MTYFRSLLLAITASICLLASPVVHGFNFEIHVITAELAYQQLPPAQQQRLEKDARALYQALDSETQAVMDRYAVSRFAASAVLPDLWRELNIEALFSSIRTPVPAALKTLPTEILSRGHYINRAYRPEISQAPGEIMSKPHIGTLFVPLQQAYGQSHEVQRAVVTAYLAHLAVDIHQPFHAVTLVDKDNPTGDRGGNNTCVLFAAKAGKHTGSARAQRRGSKYSVRCAKNLHTLFDEGVGWAGWGRWRGKTEQALVDLENSRDTQASVAWPGLETLILESAELGIKAYQPILNEKLDSPQGRAAYQKQWQPIMKQRLQLAGYRLAALLKGL